MAESSCAEEALGGIGKDFLPFRVQGCQWFPGPDIHPDFGVKQNAGSGIDRVFEGVSSGAQRQSKRTIRFGVDPPDIAITGG